MSFTKEVFQIIQDLKLEIKMLKKRETDRKAQKKYKENNYDLVKARNTAIDICNCGCKITHMNMARHLKTDKHFNLLCKKLENKNKDININNGD